MSIDIIIGNTTAVDDNRFVHVSCTSEDTSLDISINKKDGYFNGKTIYNEFKRCDHWKKSSNLKKLEDLLDIHDKYDIKHEDERITGTYIHPQIAIVLASKLSVTMGLFCLQISKTVPKSRRLLPERRTDHSLCIISTDLYRKRNIYKIGCVIVNSCTGKDITLIKENENNAKYDLYTFDHIFETSISSDVIRNIRDVLKQYRHKNHLYECDIDTLKSIINKVINPETLHEINVDLCSSCNIKSLQKQIDELKERLN